MMNRKYFSNNTPKLHHCLSQQYFHPVQMLVHDVTTSRRHCTTVYLWMKFWYLKEYHYLNQSHTRTKLLYFWLCYYVHSCILAVHVLWLAPYIFPYIFTCYFCLILPLNSINYTCAIYILHLNCTFLNTSKSNINNNVPWSKTVEFRGFQHDWACFIRCGFTLFYFFLNLVLKMSILFNHNSLKKKILKIKKGVISRDLLVIIRHL